MASLRCLASCTLFLNAALIRMSHHCFERTFIVKKVSPVILLKRPGQELAFVKIAPTHKSGVVLSIDD